MLPTQPPSNHALLLNPVPSTRHYRQNNFQGFGTVVADGDQRAVGGDEADWRQVFSADTRLAFARPSKYGVDRNVRFIDGPVNHLGGVFGPGGAVPLACPARASHDMRTGAKL